MRKMAFPIILGLVSVLIASAVHASASLSIGLTGGPGRSPEVTPGDNYDQRVVIAAGDEAADVLIEVLGYREEAENGIIPLSAEEDLGPNSARTFITPQATSVHVEPRETKTIDLNVSIPKAVGDGGRYALLRFSNVPDSQAPLGIVSTIVLPFRFTIKGSLLNHTGRIESLYIPTPENGEPIKALINLKNTGNHHYGINGHIQVKTSSGSIAFASELRAASPIPDGTNQLLVDLQPDSGLRPGYYSAELDLTLDDGSLLDSTSTTFQVPATYVAPPSPKPSPIAKVPSQPLASEPTSNMPLLISLVAGAFIIGSLGTLLAVRRRRPH